MKQLAIAVFSLTLMTGIAMAGGPVIQGSYLEARSCDVYVAACFANGEMGVSGEEATMSWNISEGAWNGVALDGLKVIAVLRANDTLGDVTGKAFETKSVVFVDDTASETQRAALVDFAKSMSNGLVSDIVKVQQAPITFKTAACDNEGCATVKAGDFLEVTTRCLHEHDKHCGNETAFYPPLTEVNNAQVLFAERDRFSAEGLGLTWDNSVRSSAYLATFAR